MRSSSALAFPWGESHGEPVKNGDAPRTLALQWYRDPDARPPAVSVIRTELPPATGPVSDDEALRSRPLPSNGVPRRFTSHARRTLSRPAGVRARIRRAKE